jgi:hypothetical protein
MKSLKVLSLGALIAVAMAKVGNADPQPVPSPGSGEMEEPALPIPDAIPWHEGPGVLPRPDELPEHAQTGQPARASSARVSTRPLLGEQAIDIHVKTKVHERAESTVPSQMILVGDSHRITTREARHLSRRVSGRNHQKRYSAHAV